MNWVSHTCCRIRFLTVVERKPPCAQQGTLGLGRMSNDINDGNQFRGCLETGVLASLPNLYEHRLVGIMTSALLNAIKVEVKDASVGQKADVVMPERKDDPETSCQAKVIVVAYFGGVGQREQRRERGLPLQELVLDLEDLGGGG